MADRQTFPVSWEFLGAAHKAKLSKLGSEAVALVKVGALREAIKLEVANAGKNGMRQDVRHEKRAEARRAVVGMHDNVEHESLEDAVGEDAGESQKLLGVGCCDGENEVGMLEHRPHVREGAAHGPPLALVERMKLLCLRFRKRVQYGLFNRRFHARLGNAERPQAQRMIRPLVPIHLHLGFVAHSVNLTCVRSG